jgi:CheY-like chemotaxis protein
MSSDEVEFPCPFCETVNRIPESLVPPSGEIRCGRCGETVALTTAPEGPRTETGLETENTGGGHRTGPAYARSETLIRVDEWEEGPAATRSREVCCPSCGHCFDPDEAEGRLPTVLIVEDTDFFLDFAAETLGRSFRTLSARTVAEARRTLATRPVDLVLLDLTLPDAEGTEVLRALPRPDIPVLIYTSRDETAMIGEEWDALARLGASDIIHKGLNMEEALVSKAEGLLADARAAR